ncbi:MAG: hypothetical protein IPP40_07480 [bacterium]|nr:hypothetical protein [bacterium]
MAYTEIAPIEQNGESCLTRDLLQVVQAAIRAKELVKQILTFSRQTEVERFPLLPGPIIKEARNSFERRYHQQFELT